MVSIRINGDEFAALLATSSALDSARFKKYRAIMLNLSNLKERAHSTEFRPFKLHLSDGRELPVPHPDFILVSRNLVVVITEEGVSYTIDPLHIVAISETTKESKAA